MRFDLLDSQMMDHLVSAVPQSATAETYMTMLRTLSHLSRSNVWAGRAVNANFEILCHNLLESREESSISLAVEFLWNVLDCDEGSKAATIIASTDLCFKLKEMFEYSIVDSHRAPQKQIRNDLAVATNAKSIVHRFDECGFSTIIFDQLLRCEVNHKAVSDQALLTNAPEDYEYKRLLINLCSAVVIDANILEKYLQGGFMKFILMYMDYNSPVLGVKIWSLRQLKGLQKMLINLLTQILPASLDEFTACSGNDILLSFLDAAKKQDSPIFHGCNPESEPIGLVPAVLKTLLTLSELGVEVKVKLGRKGLFQKLFGVFLLLDLLESLKSLSGHVLGCMLDLLENPKARPHVLEWKRKRAENAGIGQLLVELWMSEERNLGVPERSDGILGNTSNPLAGKLARKDLNSIDEISSNLRAKIYSFICKLDFENTAESLSTNEKMQLAYVSLIPHASHVSQTDSFSYEYGSFKIGKYLDFKIGEVWQEIATELHFENIKPVSLDQICIETSQQVIEEKAKAVQMKQMELGSKGVEIQKDADKKFVQEWLIRKREGLIETNKADKKKKNPSLVRKQL
ncbi:hypothetical protein HK102_009483 [Quaeritorhiza haematococci]|nr:hypothetical protein HK102_009483 [Quaeritorhiza haematococci]